LEGETNKDRSLDGRIGKSKRQLFENEIIFENSEEYYSSQQSSSEAV